MVMLPSGVGVRVTPSPTTVREPARSALSPDPRARDSHVTAICGTLAPVTNLLSLGTVLMVWAHPDDETYLVGGLSAALTDAGQRVVCVTATRGEAGGDAADLAEIRTAELDVALAMLGVDEHHWLDYPDGGCAVVDDARRRRGSGAVVDEVRPDTVVTFGPDGFTGHPDHQAVSRWVDLAVASYDVRAAARRGPRAPRRPRASTRTSGSSSWAARGSCADDELAVLPAARRRAARPQGGGVAGAGVADGRPGRGGRA